MRYGGNTTCLEVRSAGGAVVVIDAGTGIRNLGRALADESLHHLDLLLTHLHLDHIEGLGFFALLFDPESTIKIHGPRPTNGTLKEKIAAYLSPPYFPVPFERIDARLSFEEIENDSWDINGLRISSAPVCHPGPTLAYRIEASQRSSRVGDGGARTSTRRSRGTATKRQAPAAMAARTATVTASRVPCQRLPNHWRIS